MKKRHSESFGKGSAGAIVGLLIATGGLAADFTWEGTSGTSWNETDANWSGAATVWASAPTNNATFGVSDTKTVAADALTLSNLIFTADGYAVGGGLLTMHGVPSVASGLNAVLSATVTNIGVWAKAGAGTLTVDPGAGNTNVFYALKAAEGTLEMVSGTNFVTQSGSSPESNPFFWVTGGKLVVGGGIVKAKGNMFGRVSEFGTLLITNGIVDLTSASELLNGHNSPGVVTVSDTGLLDVQMLRISQNSSAANLTVVNVNTGGVIRLNRFNLDTTYAKNGTVNFNGGMIVAKNNLAQEDMLGTTSPNWRNIVVNVLPGGAIINNNGCSITLRQNMTGSPNDGGLTKLNSGYLYVRGTNSYTGATVLRGGALNIIRDHNLGTVPASPATNVLFLTSSTLQSSDTHALSANRTIWVTNAVTAAFDTQSYTQTVYGTVMCAETNSTVVKSGSGSLVLDPGPSAVNAFGTLQTTAGTLVIASGTNLVTAPNKGQNAPGLRVSGGTMLVAGGVVKTTNLMFVNVDGGHLLITNGLVDTTSCYEVLNGIGSTYGFTTVSGGGTLLANGIRISQNTGNPSNTVVSVNTGGVMRLNNFYIDINANQKGMLVLNGGTVEPRVDNPNFLGTTEVLVGNNNDKWLTNIFIHVREGGAIFDTAGRTISIKQPLYTGAPVDGGFIKRGAGILTLLNTNTYNGVTTVEGGTLKWGRDDVLPPTNTVMAASNGVFDVNGKTQTLAGIGGGGTVTNLAALTVTGTVAPGDAGAFGTLTLAGPPASLAGCTLAVNVSTNGACGRLHVAGDLSLAALSLSVGDAAQLNRFKRYTVASCTGTLTAPFGSVAALPPRWTVKYDTVAKTAYLVYDFGTLISVR